MKSLISDLHKAFSLLEDKNSAAKMKNYLKGQFAFYGVKAADRKQITKEFLKIHPLNDIDQLKEFVKLAWEQDQREFQLLAIDILIKYKKNLQLEDASFVLSLIKSKSWWDTVDMIASHLIGQILLQNRTKFTLTIKAWVKDDNMWVRRTAIISQLKHKAELDTTLLNYALTNNFGSKEFFINKAIGWILREHSKLDPNWVVTFIDNNKKSLSNLSIREGSKYL